MSPSTYIRRLALMRPCGRLASLRQAMGALRARIGRPSVFQILVDATKSLIAALASWEITGVWHDGTQRYAAVAMALLMVNSATVYGSVTQAARRSVTQVAGVAVAVGATPFLGSALSGSAGVLIVAVIAGGRRASDDRLHVATTALLTLTAVTAGPIGNTIASTAEILTGAAVGIAVNALVLPPMNAGESDAAVRELARAMGAFLREMGGGLREHQHVVRAQEWQERGRELERRVADVNERLLQAQESLRWNSRVLLHDGRPVVADVEVFQALQTVALQVRGIAWTLVHNAPYAEGQLGQLFLERYADTLEWAGRAVEEFADPEWMVGAEGTGMPQQLHEASKRALEWHETMTELIDQGALVEPRSWHIYGSLMTCLEGLLIDLEHAYNVADSTAAEVSFGRTPHRLRCPSLEASRRGHAVSGDDSMPTSPRSRRFRLRPG
ncbi:hypothetical protein [Streptomyces sp. NPDC055105]|uniref:hypothetical protein n=1 Tax=Streptomyces sp. NPDC055105 TaxID=3365719 RepID=UPI0037CE9CD1